MKQTRSRWAVAALALLILVILAPGQLNAACTNGAKVIGFAWKDFNLNGLQDDQHDEPEHVEHVEYVKGITYRSKDSTGSVQESTTDLDGSYSFTDLCAGTYTVEVVPATIPPYLAPTLIAQGDDARFDSNAFPATVILDPGQTDETVDQGFTLCGECKGGLMALSLRYKGSDAANITVFSETMVFDGLVQPEGIITVFGDDRHGKLRISACLWTAWRPKESTPAVRSLSLLELNSDCSR